MTSTHVVAAAKLGSMDKHNPHHNPHRSTARADTLHRRARASFLSDHLHVGVPCWHSQAGRPDSAWNSTRAALRRQGMLRRRGPGFLSKLRQPLQCPGVAWERQQHDMKRRISKGQKLRIEFAPHEQHGATLRSPKSRDSLMLVFEVFGNTQLLWIEQAARDKRERGPRQRWRQSRLLIRTAVENKVLWEQAGTAPLTGGAGEIGSEVVLLVRARRRLEHEALRVAPERISCPALVAVAACRPRRC